MIYLVYLRGKKFKCFSLNSCLNGEVYVRFFFGVDSVSVGKIEKVENFFSLLLLKIIVSFWKSGKVNNEYFNKKF